MLQHLTSMSNLILTKLFYLNQEMVLEIRFQRVQVPLINTAVAAKVGEKFR